MARLGLETQLVDGDVYKRTLTRFREAGVVLPKFAELKDPSTIPPAIAERLADIDPDSPHPLNLFRVHWFNDASRRGRAETPRAIELPPELTGSPARIVLALGNRFPMIRAHKVLAAYGCLAPRVVTGQFDPTRHRAIWPSTGNYCRGGVAISRILDCRGVAVLPENMSQERFDWLDRWVAEPGDIVRTPGSESNVKEIYDACAALERDPANIVFNQFCEYGNYLVHRLCTGAALERVFQPWPKVGRATGSPPSSPPRARRARSPRATISRRRSARRSRRSRRSSARRCSMNGFGEHNIQGIGDKHVPLIHNVMNTDVVDRGERPRDRHAATLFNTDEGRRYLVERRGVDPALVAALDNFGISSICNIVAAVKLAKYFDLGPDDVVLTVATDGAEMYGSEVRKAIMRYFGNRFDAVSAGETWGRRSPARRRPCARAQPRRPQADVQPRLFHLGRAAGRLARRFPGASRRSFWDGLLDLAPAWDAMIEKFNAESGAAAKLS